MKFKIALLILPWMWLSSAQAYPWLFFRQETLPRIVELDTYISYFLKDETTVFSGIHLDYHRPTIDINLGYNYSFLEKKHYFRLSELAVIFPFISEEWKMILGFKDVLWSEADRYWNYGLWQPRYMLDPFRPVQMGLPGVYLDYKGDTSFLFLFSYFYLPDIIIYPKLENKQITSENPFFVGIFEQFRWNIDKLDLFQLNRFFKPTVAFQIRHFIKDSNLSFSYAYKPVNQLQYSVFFQKVDLSSDEKGALVVDDFNYSVVSHHLASLEGEVALSEGVSLFASLFYEKPEKQKYGTQWFSDEFESHLTVSLLAYFQEKLGEKSKTLFTLGWTKTMENRSSKEASNTMTEDLEPVFSRGFYWKNALSASIEYHDKSLFNGFLFRLRGNYALDNKVYAFALENYFYLTPHIRVYLSGDAIPYFSDTALKAGTSFIKQYKDLSRLLVGGQYVF